MFRHTIEVSRMLECYKEEHVSGLHRIGARPRDVLEFVRSCDPTVSVGDNALASAQERWYGNSKQDYATSLTRHFASRLSFGQPEFLPIKQFVLHLDSHVFPLINHFFMLHSDPYYRWSAAEYLPRRYELGLSDLTSAILVPELQKRLPPSFRPLTVARQTRGVMASLRDNGLLVGKATKTIVPPEVPLKALAFFLYYHADCGIGAGDFETTPLFRSLLRPREYYLSRFQEGARHGYWDFDGNATHISASLRFSDMSSWIRFVTEDAE